jgi:hypothetical protein
MKIRILLLLGGIVLVTVLVVHERRRGPAPETVEMVAPPAANLPPVIQPATPVRTNDIPSETVRAVLAATNLNARMANVRALPRDLSPDEIENLLQLLGQAESSPSVPRGFTVAFKNELILALRNQVRPVEGLPSALIALFRNQRADVALRDYAVQHLASWCEELLARGTETSETRQKKQEAFLVFREALSETSSSIAGTALLSLHRLPAIDDETLVNVSDAATRLLNDANTGELTQITAIQVCAERGQREQLPRIIEVATSHSSVPMRLSAIAAIAALGDSKETETLKAFVRSTDSRLSKAAHTALARLESRLRSQNQNI